jgi:hypothetical protein
MHKENTEEKKSYRWIEGECLAEYSASAAKWKQHTSTVEFAEAFTAIAKTYATDNALRSE